MKTAFLTLGLLVMVSAPLHGAELILAQSGAQPVPDDLPPPRTTTRKPRPVEPDALVPQTAAEAAADLPAPVLRKPAARGFRPSLKTGVDDLLLELGALPDSREADTYSTLRASAYVLWQPLREWEFRAGARVDGMIQDGGTNNHREMRADTPTPMFATEAGIPALPWVRRPSSGAG